MLVEALAECAGHNPRLVIECVQYLIKGDVEGWAIHSWRDALRAIFGVTLGSNDVRVVSQTRSVINRLGERGFFEFGDLLSS